MIFARRQYNYAIGWNVQRMERSIKILVGEEGGDNKSLTSVKEIWSPNIRPNEAYFISLGVKFLKCLSNTPSNGEFRRLGHCHSR